MLDSLKILGLVALGLSVLSLIGYGIGLARAKTEELEDKKIKYILGHVLDLADTVVEALNQTVVEPLKNSDKLEFDVEAQKRVLETAKDKIKNRVDDKTYELLGQYLGGYDKIDGYIEDVVEKKVHEKKYSTSK